MPLLNAQKGRFTLGPIASIGVIILVVIFAMRVTPIYINYFTVVSIAEEALEQEGAARTDRATLRKAVNQRFRTNANLHHLKPDQVIRVEMDRQRSGGLMLIVDYQVSTPLVGNMDITVSFHREVRP